VDRPASPTVGDPGPAGGATLAALVAGFVRRHRAAYAAAAGMLAVIALIGVWVPRQVGAIVDGLVAHRLGGRALAIEIGWLLAAGVAIYALRVAWRLRLYATSYRMGVELRCRLYERLTRQGAAFFQQHRTGDLMALATNDIDAVELAVGDALLAGFDGTLTLLLVVATMALGVDARLTLVALLPFPAMALGFWWISRHLHDNARAALAAFGRLNDQVQESLSGVRTLRALGLEARSSARFGTLAADAAATAFAAQRWEARYEPAVGWALTSAIVLSLAYGGALVWRGEITVGALTSFGLYLGKLIWPMFAAGWVLALLERGRAAWGRLAPVLEAPLAVDDRGRIQTVPSGEIVARALSFGYPGGGAAVLTGVDFVLAPGRTLALVGPTGSGKSTLLKLLLRHWTPQSGSLTWSGVALADYSLAALRAAVAWVPQEPFLFSTTLAENIALARPQATRAEVEAVARLAAVHDDIVGLPQGYDTPVGERGVTLSGGQRQRVAIARALLADAPLLLLDEALSAVDSHTENRILAALRLARYGRSVVIASHRLSTVQDADQILVLRHGRVAERGDHAALLAAGGWYATQWRVQQLEASIERD
jgi:ATP-binding cassette subfamily B multidrug efflux pump